MLECLVKTVECIHTLILPPVGQVCSFSSRYTVGCDLGLRDHECRHYTNQCTNYSPSVRATYLWKFGPTLQVFPMLLYPQPSYSNQFSPHPFSRYSSDGIATRYGMDGPGIESRRGVFRTRPDRSCGPPSLLYNGYGVSFAGVQRPGRGVDHPPHLAPRLKKE